MYTDDTEISEISPSVARLRDKRCPTDFQALPIGVLHLGVKSAALDSAGFQTVDDLDHLISMDQIAILPDVGRSTARRIITNRQALIDSWNENTGIDWDTYCRKLGVSLVPQGGRPSTGTEFLTCLPDFFCEVAQLLTDQTSAAILRERIRKPPRERSTLEEIAAYTNPPVTRERVRQKQRKLLDQLTGGLLFDDYRGLGIHFRPEFTYWWRLAIEEFSDIEELEFDAFVERIAAVWDVPVSRIISQLPVILAVVTGEPQMTGDFRARSHIHPKLFGNLSDDLCNLPVSRLRLGKYAHDLTECGTENFGQLVTRLRGCGEEPVNRKTERMAGQHANLLATCISENGSVDWKSYQIANKLQNLPDQPILSSIDFVSGLCGVIAKLLAACQVPTRSVKIYRLRTSKSARDRRTLHSVAEEMQTYSSSIKREETVFLKFLNDVLINHDFSMMPFWLDDSWLEKWDEARDAFETSNNNYSDFTDSLAWRWRLTVSEVSEAVPTIWAVLSGYPNGRRARGKGKKLSGLGLQPAVSPSQLPVGLIRLIGFRRAH